MGIIKKKNEIVFHKIFLERINEAPQTSFSWYINEQRIESLISAFEKLSYLQLFSDDDLIEAAQEVLNDYALLRKNSKSFIIKNAKEITEIMTHTPEGLEIQLQGLVKRLQYLKAIATI